MNTLQKLETTLDELINRKMRYQQPEETRRSLAHAWWWIALVAGVVQLYGAWALWRLSSETNKLLDGTGSAGQQLGDTGVNPGFFLCLTVFVLLVDGALLLLASPGLKRLNKLRGWNLLFYALLLNLLAGLVRLFINVDGSMLSFILAIFGSIAALYLLFQTRSYFLPHKPSGRTVGVEKTRRKTV